MKELSQFAINKRRGKARKEMLIRFSLGLKIIKAQLFLLLVFTMSLLIDINIGRALLIGGLIAFISTLILYVHIFKYQGAQQAKNILNSLYRAEIVKVLAISLGFFVAFKWVDPLYPAGVLIGFGIAQLAFWVVPMVDTQTMHMGIKKYQ